jgi:hypothetical protein
VPRLSAGGGGERRRCRVMARHPFAAVAAFLVVGAVVVFGAFLLLAGSTESDPDPRRQAALTMADRLVSAQESVATDTSDAGSYIFRVVFQSTDANVGTSQFATHIGVAVCLRDGRATQAARFSYLHFEPSCHDGRLELRPAETSAAEDRKRWDGEFVEGADARDEPTPRRIGAP